MVIVVGLNRVEGVGALFHAPVSICGLSVLMLKRLSPTVNLLLFSFLHCGLVTTQPIYDENFLVYCAAPSLCWMERGAHHWKQRYQIWEALDTVYMQHIAKTLRTEPN